MLLEASGSVHSGTATELGSSLLQGLVSGVSEQMVVRRGWLGGWWWGCSDLHNARQRPAF